jgi:hypothetical protein
LGDKLGKREKWPGYGSGSLLVKDEVKESKKPKAESWTALVTHRREVLLTSKTAFIHHKALLADRMAWIIGKQTSLKRRGRYGRFLTLCRKMD